MPANYTTPMGQTFVIPSMLDAVDVPQSFEDSNTTFDCTFAPVVFCKLKIVSSHVIIDFRNIHVFDVSDRLVPKDFCWF